MPQLRGHSKIATNPPGASTSPSPPGEVAEGRAARECTTAGRAGESAAVRSIADFNYVGVGLGLLARGELAAAVPADFPAAAVAYFEGELLADGWVRALSLEDPVMADVMSPDPPLEALVAMRADWTGTGAYAGLAGQAASRPMPVRSAKGFRVFRVMGRLVSVGKGTDRQQRTRRYPARVRVRIAKAAAQARSGACGRSDQRASSDVGSVVGLHACSSASARRLPGSSRSLSRSAAASSSRRCCCGRSLC